MKKLNWGIIGTGDVTEKKSGPGLYKAENSNLLAVYNRTPKKAVDYANRHNVARVYETAKGLINDKEIDVVYIATPPDSHKAYAIEALEAGKIPYIEKPLTLSYSDAKEIQQLSEKLNIPVYIAFYRRGLEKFIAIKRILEKEVIGDIRFVTITQTATVAPEFLNQSNLPWRVIPEISGGGLFMDIGSHVLDCLMMFFGELETMNGFADNNGGHYPAEDTIMASFKFKNGISGTGNWCFTADETKNEVEIVGNKGRIIYDALSVKRFKVIVDGQELTYEFEEPEHIAMPYQVSIINEILGKEKSNANFAHAVNLMKMTDRILEPYYNKL